MELYTKLLHENQGMGYPNIREVMLDQSFVVSSFATSLAEKLEQQLGHSRPQQLGRPREQCGCGVVHGSQSPLNFPEDSYEDEPDEGSFDGEDDDYEDEDDLDEDYDDEDEDDEDNDDNDDEESFDEDDAYDDEYDDGIEHDLIDGYSHHYAADRLAAFAMEEEKRVFNAIFQAQKVKRPLPETFLKQQILDAQKRKQEEVRIQLLQKLRLEDEIRRKREQEEKQRKERVELEMRKKRETDEADQKARTFLFVNTFNGQVEIVKKLLETSPEDSGSIVDIPTFATVSAMRLTGWESVSNSDDGISGHEAHEFNESLLHVASRTGCTDLVAYFIDKGAPLDAMDSAGRIPLHGAAESGALEVCRLLLEKAPYHTDKISMPSAKTALHYAAQNGYGDVVALLLQYNARVSAIDAHGQTPEMLAKAGLERGKSSKARAQKYRATSHHLQKAAAAIKEAQRQRDALLEEQRRKEEELAREEAEKDRAARRKQEEKLEADQRRRESEEKELARMKASATDLHGSNNSGGSSKKKKKRKGKGNDIASTLKDTLPAKVPTIIVQSNFARSTSSSPAESPAILQGAILLNAASKDQVTHSTAITGASPVPPIRSVLPDSTAGAVSTSTQSVAACSPVMTAAASPKIEQVQPLRLPKVKTSYRPSQLVVTRMADMGFTARSSRKALIQTEGKFEEAIELLTSGSPLADDSEDEAERVAVAEATRRRAANLTETVGTAPISGDQVLVNRSNTAPVSAIVHQPASLQPDAPSTVTSKRSLPQRAMTNVSSGSGVQDPSRTSKTRTPGPHPVQMLQRQNPVSPTAQLRPVPMQVLQRPSATAPLNNLQKQFQTHAHLPADSSVPTTIATELMSIPFLAPRLAPPRPPTRQPYSYGTSSPSQKQSQSVTIPTSLTVPPSSFQTEIAVREHTFVPPTVPDIPLISSVNLGDGIKRHHHYRPLSDTDHKQTNLADTPIIWEVSSPLPYKGLPKAHFPATFSQDLSVTPKDIPRSHAQHNANNYSSSRVPAALLETSSLSLARSRVKPNRMPQGQMDMDSPLDGDMVKDVLAMTGAIDLDDLEHTLAGYSVEDMYGLVQPVVSRPSVAVGEGRSQALRATQNPVTSLWGYGSFTQDASSLNKSWSSSPTRKDLVAGKAVTESMGGYHRWHTEYELPQSSLMSADSVLQDAHISSFVDRLHSTGPSASEISSASSMDHRYSSNASASHRNRSDNSTSTGASIPGLSITRMGLNHDYIAGYRSFDHSETPNGQQPSTLPLSSAALSSPSSASLTHPWNALTSATTASGAATRGPSIPLQSGHETPLLSPGIQALNNALNHARYPKLDETVHPRNPSSAQR
ncbi:hypothetical protein EDD11_006091 [Mortierella claussenii]|nr:hypothetical protein EDD11_006091 [Mortierella claussenii]